PGRRLAGGAVRLPDRAALLPEPVLPDVHAPALRPAPGRPRLPAHPRDHVRDQPPGHRGDPGARLPAGLPPGDRPAPDRRAHAGGHHAAAADERPRPDLRVDGPPRSPRCGQRGARGARPPRCAAAPALHPHRGDHRDGPRPAPLHGPAALQRHEGNRRRAGPGRPEPRGQPAPGLLPRLHPAESPGDRRGLRPGFRGGDRLLRHARPPGRPPRHDDRHAHREPGPRAAELGAGVGLARHAAGGHRRAPARVPAVHGAGPRIRRGPMTDPAARARALRLEEAGPLGRRSAGLWVAGALVLAFLALPTTVVLPISFSAAKYLTFPPPGWSLQWYERYFGSRVWMAATWRSFEVAILTMAAATSVGTAAALALRRQFRGRALVNLVILAPMVVPVIVTAIGVYGLYARLRLVGTIPGLVLAHTVLALPFVVVVVG